MRSYQRHPVGPRIRLREGRGFAAGILKLRQYPDNYSD